MARKIAFHPLNKKISVYRDPMLPIYLLRGIKNYLVDATVSSHAPLLLQALENELRESSLDGILLTHTHYDHCGALSLLQQRYDCPVYLSERGRDVLTNPKAIALIIDLNREFAVREKVNAPIFSAPAKLQGQGEGALIPFDLDEKIEVIATPGHTRCSISFLLPKAGILFPGDASGVIERSGLYKPLFLSSYRDYLASIEKMAELDIEILGLPHNKPIRGRKKVKEHFQHAAEAAARTRQLIQDHPGNDQNLEETALKLLALEFNQPALSGPKSAMLINAMAMIKAIRREFPAQ